MDRRMFCYRSNVLIQRVSSQALLIFNIFPVLNAIDTMRSNFHLKLVGLTSILFLFISISITKAGEGMWLPQLLQSLNEKEMKSMGMKMSAADIYSVNSGSLKDAVLLFNGGCTGEVV